MYWEVKQRSANRIAKEITNIVKLLTHIFVALKGQIPWNKGMKGIVKYSEETKLKRKGMFTGDKNPAWKGGRFTEKRGYVNVWVPDHPYANKSGYIREHRLVMENHIGRYLTKDEVVHHKDENPSNNDISNLELYEKNITHLVENHLKKDMSDRVCIRCNRSHEQLTKKLNFGVRWNKMHEGWLCSSCRATLVSRVREIKRKKKT